MAQQRTILQRGSRSARALLYAAATTLLVTTMGYAVRASGIDLVRMDGVLGETSAPGSVAQLTLAVGTKSIPLSVTRAQRISGVPASAPEIFSALGPGPPPVRVEGREAMTKKLTDAPVGTRVTITGNLDVANAFLTLMEVDDSAGAQ